MICYGAFTKLKQLFTHSLKNETNNDIIIIDLFRGHQRITIGSLILDHHISTVLVVFRGP